MTKKENNDGHTANELKKRLEPLPSNGDALLVSGRSIDLSVAISLKRIADNLETLVGILGKPRRTQEKK